MKTATVTDLRYRFGTISKWLEAGEAVHITKHGKPFAIVVPEPRGLLGRAQGMATVPTDIDEPLGIEWEAMQ